MNTPTITPEKAAELGFRPIINPCQSNEMWIAEAVAADMQRGGITHAFVQENGGVSVWRTGAGWIGN